MTWTVFVTLHQQVIEEYGPYYTTKAAEECAAKESLRYGTYCYAEVYDNEKDQPSKVFKRGHVYSLKRYLTEDD